MKHIIFVIVIMGSFIGSVAMESDELQPSYNQQSLILEAQSPKNSKKIKDKGVKKSMVIPAGYMLISHTNPRQGSLFPDGKIQRDKLYLNIKTQESFLRYSFEEILQDNRPFVVLAVVTTKVNDQYVYNVFDAVSLNSYLFGQTYTRGLKNEFVTRFKNPINNQIIIGEIDYYMLSDVDQPLEFLGTSYDLFLGSNEMQKKTLRFVIQAGTGDLAALNKLILFYSTANMDDKQESLLKKMMKNKSQNESAVIRLAHLYAKQGADNNIKFNEALNIVKSLEKSKRMYITALIYEKMPDEKGKNQARYYRARAIAEGLLPEDKIVLDEIFNN